MIAMSKTSETKKKILDLLKTGNKRLIDIYPVLGLSAATVSQHLKELKEMNLIIEIDNSHFKNEKYYSINKDYAENNYLENKATRRSFSKLGFGIIGIVIVIAAFALFFNYSSPKGSSQSAQYSSAPSNTLNILLTDPPHVPAGTQTLNVTYSSVQIHLANASSRDWITLNSTGTLDLLSLVNISKVIGSVQVPSNATIDTVALNITQAEIGIDNQSYPVSLSTNRVAGQVSNSGSFNGTSDLLVDFSPTILTLYNNNATLFQMVPSLTAVMVGKQHLSQGPGQSPKDFVLDANTSAGLRALCGGLNITYSEITSSGNNTQIEVTVKDTSNKTIDLQHVLIFGNESLYLNPNPTGTGAFGINTAQFPYSQNGVAKGAFIHGNGINETGRYYNSDQGGRRGNFTNANFTHQIPPLPSGIHAGARIGAADMDINFTNAYNWTSGNMNSSWNPSGTMPPPMQNGKWVEVGGVLNFPRNMIVNPSSAPEIEAHVNQAYAIGAAKQRLGVIGFTVNQNATLSLLSGYPMPYSPNMEEYVIGPGQSVTLVFNGTIGLGGNLVKANFTSGTKYRVVVIGNDGAYVESNVSVS